MEIKLFSIVFMEHGYGFYFLNSLGTLLDKKQVIELNSFSLAIPTVDEYHFNIANFASSVLGVEDKGRSIEKELGTILEYLPISLFLNPSLSFHEVSFEELNSANLVEFHSNVACFVVDIQRNRLEAESFLRERVFELCSLGFRAFISLSSWK
ncbi:hypothetical protein M9H77_23829 [Catharanthus roseus]|uniref:Uncharacterized protein n=1 Tax=Catharanthus roseus TaxID=4058 RepID=A0ACC0AV67_CATRO|nr:hypothetical protein M9H77_23829 [Catharanthus roseus]